MNLLAVDTATAVLSLALAAGENTWRFEADAGLRHSELLMDGVDLLLREAGIAQRDLSGVLCTGGPGSFTGLRIGFSLAKGLALALGIPFAAVPTLDCMAYHFSAWPGIVAPAIDARGNAFFCALYRNGDRICTDMDAGPAEIGRAIERMSRPQDMAALLTGPGAAALYHALPAELIDSGLVRLDVAYSGGSAAALLTIAKKSKILNNNPVDWFSGPEYIRKSDAELRQGL
jgi:tRNA threonylcarbamoyladenosine biosynthesis protein TsaB